MATGFPDDTRFVVVLELTVNEHLVSRARDRQTGALIPGHDQLSPQPVDNHRHTVTHVNDDVLRALKDARAELDRYIEAIQPIVAKLPANQP